VTHQTYTAVPDEIEREVQLSFVQNEIRSLMARREQITRLIRVLASAGEPEERVKQQQVELAVVLGRLLGYREQEAELLAALNKRP